MKKSFLILILLFLGGSPVFYYNKSYATPPLLDCQYFVKDFDLEYSADNPLELNLEKLELSDPLNDMKTVAVKLANGFAQIIYDEKLDRFYISINNKSVLAIIPNRNYVLNRNWVVSYRAKGNFYLIGDQIAVEPIGIENITTTYALFFINRITCNQLLSQQNDRIRDLKKLLQSQRNQKEEDYTNEQILDQSYRKPRLNADINSVKKYADRSVNESAYFDSESSGFLDFEGAKRFGKDNLELEDLKDNMEKELKP